MLVLLPPSEGKASIDGTGRPRRGTPVRLETLSFPQLTTAREQVLDALVEASSRPDAAPARGWSS